ncbi:MAG: cob(I)alamin adenosyltransferase [Clostridiales bacterium]|jgi:cob(I)alamin adenosyltransferase|nr:cob(I)alamin adenosyltransferase [Clostridiales bacterium]
MRKGYIQVYTGNGKGKTTAALGLAMRAVGRGLKVIMIQFLKGIDSGELHSAQRLAPEFTIYRFESSHKFIRDMSDDELAQLRQDISRGFGFAKQVIRENACDILILDEIMAAIHSGFVSIPEVVELMRSKPDNMELVLTGRNVPDEIADLADLITEMKPIKHYYDKGVTARKGIEL